MEPSGFGKKGNKVKKKIFRNNAFWSISSSNRRYGSESTLAITERDK